MVYRRDKEGKILTAKLAQRSQPHRARQHARAVWRDDERACMVGTEPSTPTEMTMRPGAPSLAPAVLKTGLVAGVLDAIAAMTQYTINGGKNPTVVWNYVASGAFGPEARTGGLPFAAAGLLLHFCIAMIWATLFYLVAVRVPALRKSPVLSGVVYGLFVWTMMTRLIVPLSRIGPPKSFNPTQAAIGAAIIVVCVGLPIALRARRDLGPA
jgi:hypothetical protein